MNTPPAPRQPARATPPVATAAAAAPDPRRVNAARAEQALAALDIAVPAVDTPVAYGVAIGFLALWLTLIPVVYLALLAFMAYLFAWHVWQTFASFGQGPFFLFHIPMAVVGGLLLLFLVKPVFFRPKKKDGRVLTVARNQEPALFGFVDKLCEVTGAPVPTTIEIDCEPNAGARFQHVFLGLFDRRLVLRVGLPLVAALNVRQFAGVLAHEFGHFNQRSGMTGSALVRMLAYFFAKVVFQRDRLDEKLANLRRSRNALGRAAYRVSVLLIEANRGVLWLMLTLSELLSHGVLRRMEYDADNAEAHIAGTRDFERTGKLLMFLGLAARRARNDLAAAWEEQRLADDFPRLIVANARQLAEHRTDVLKLLAEQRTSWFDTHPCHADRVANVARIGAEGLVRCDAPAKCLFKDFAATCHAATRVFYAGVLGNALTTAKLVPTAELVQQRAGDRVAFKALRRFFRDHVIGLRPIFPGPDAARPAADATDLACTLSDHRQAMLGAAESVGPVVRSYEKAGPSVAVARAQVALCALFPPSPAVQGLRRRAHRELGQQEPAYAAAVNRLPGFEQLARERLTSALRLLQCDPVAAQLAPADPAAAKAAQRSAAKLIAACHAMQPCLPTVYRLREIATRLRVFYAAYNPQSPFQPLVNHLLGTGREAGQLLAKLRDDLAVPYPFEHATAGVTIGNALVPKLPDFQDPAATYAAVGTTLDRFYTLTFRTLARLTERAEQVEVACGLEPLTDPPEKAEEGDDDARAEAAEQRKNTRRYWLGYGGRAVAGIFLLWGLVWLSANPPSFGSSGGAGVVGGRAGYDPYARPTPFRAPFQSRGGSAYGPSSRQPAHPGWGTADDPFPNMSDLSQLQHGSRGTRPPAGPNLPPNWPAGPGTTHGPGSPRGR